MAERINAVKTSFFGKGAIRLLGPELQKMGIRRALLVTDRFLYDSGAAARVGQVLSVCNGDCAVLSAKGAVFQIQKGHPVFHLRQRLQVRPDHARHLVHLSFLRA